jgi:RNA polymerase sigma-70 factor (ECF subfamily)
MTAPKIDSSVILSFKRGNEASFNLIFETYKNKIYYYIFRFCKNSADTEELVQQVFIKIWMLKHKIDHTRNFEAFLFKVTRNLVFDHLRKKALHFLYLHVDDPEVILPDFASAHPDDDFTFEEYHKLALTIIDELPEKRQIIFKMNYEEGKSIEEIAELLQLSTHTVKSQLVKAFKTIRQKLVGKGVIASSFSIILSCFFQIQ